VSVQEAFHRPFVDELGIISPTEAKNKLEGKDRLGSLDLKIAPIALGLVTGLGLEPGEGQAVLLRFDRADEASHRIIAPAISMILQLFPYPSRLIIVFLQEVADHLLIGCQDRNVPFDFPIPGKIRLDQVLLNRGPMQAQLLGDRPDAFPVPLHRLNVHVYLLGNHPVSPPLFEKTIPPFQIPGGTLFMPITCLELRFCPRPNAGWPTHPDVDDFG